VIQAWRLVKSKHAATAFTGFGARLAGGRWNHRGTPVVYISGTLSLAVLELFVHLERRSRTTLALVTFPVRIPPHLVSAPETLPRDWRAEPPPRQTKDLGTAWVAAGTSCVLEMPSVVVPQERNFMLNPGHPDFQQIEIGDPEPFSLDPRMWK
jgi:RES domain-containing protein